MYLEHLPYSHTSSSVTTISLIALTKSSTLSPVPIHYSHRIPTGTHVITRWGGGRQAVTQRAESQKEIAHCELGRESSTSGSLAVNSISSAPVAARRKMMIAMRPTGLLTTYRSRRFVLYLRRDINDVFSMINRDISFYSNSSLSYIGDICRGR